MADINDVVTNSHILEIADAIRDLQETLEGMTILEMPQKIRDIKTQVLDVVNSLVDALCWRGTCEGVPVDTIIGALTWR